MITFFEVEDDSGSVLLFEDHLKRIDCEIVVHDAIFVS